MPAEGSAGGRPWDDRCDSNLIVDLNVKCRTMKLLEDKIGGHIVYLGLDDGLLAMTPKAQSEKEIIYNLNFIKITCERHSQENEKTNHRLEEKYMQKTYLIKDYY